MEKGGKTKREKPFKNQTKQNKKTKKEKNIYAQKKEKMCYHVTCEWVLLPPPPLFKKNVDAPISFSCLCEVSFPFLEPLDSELCAVSLVRRHRPVLQRVHALFVSQLKTAGGGGIPLRTIGTCANAL